MKTSIDKRSKIVVLSGGFEPEKYSASITGKVILRTLINIGYKNSRMINVNSSLVKNLEVIRPDFVFVSVFCKWGEDGIIQGLLEVLGIPYSGCGIEASVICNNKFIFNQFVKSLGFLTPETLLCLSEEEAIRNIKNIKFPFIVKPACQGNSLGVSLVYKIDEFKKAVRKSFLFSSKIILQEYIEGKEYTVGVIDHPSKGPVILPITEFPSVTLINNVEMKDSDKGEAQIPANLTKKQLMKLIMQVGIIYKSVGCSGLSRFDVRRREENFFFLENNTFPGLSDHSYIIHQLRAANIPLAKLIEYMIIAGLSRKPMKIDYSFK